MVGGQVHQVSKLTTKVQYGRLEALKHVPIKIGTLVSDNTLQLKVQCLPYLSEADPPGLEASADGLSLKFTDAGEGASNPGNYALRQFQLCNLQFGGVGQLVLAMPLDCLDGKLLAAESTSTAQCIVTLPLVGGYSQQRVLAEEAQAVVYLGKTLQRPPASAPET